MGILDRISTILRSNINSALDKAENPEKMLDQIIRDMSSAIEEAKGQVAGVIAQEKQTEAEMNSNLRQSQEWSDRAEKAVKAGRDDLAREALRRKKDLEGIATTYKQQFDTQHQMSQQLRTQLDALIRKYEDSVRNRDVMLARYRTAQAQQQINKQMSAMSGLDHSSEIGRMDRRIREMEARSAAEAELNKGSSTLEDQFAQLDATDDMDDDLKALKSKMGMGGNA
ncbi:MAG: PspA/IM30 family protein [Chloroflexi bacterium]|uniref:PspA/IM30 family protein n=1 Tax=Candidatus Chlorohelix allophototropha TaxID=3003348 RepID=A0A8T7M2U0_9CHLR|nr:PspA/IM30 family protein [Chloroflexota bacterium]WJW66786.1 PspA/IM30 family protein [Chloroflexota bacterium L227-S17]